MVRQCAWCLRLIDSAGERLSQSPLPKLYEASHGICDICGTQWMEQVTESQELSVQETPFRNECDDDHPDLYLEIERFESITQLVLKLQQRDVMALSIPWLKHRNKLRIS